MYLHLENLDLLNTNKFVSTGVYNLSSNKKKEDYLRKQMEFRQFMEQKKSKFTMGGLEEVRLVTHPIMDLMELYLG